MTSKEQTALISSINWFHRIDLGNGLVTPGDDNTPLKLRRLQFPENLAGKTFLDIGAWDGFFSFEAEKRGATRVLATDSFVWKGNVAGKSKEGFLTARSLLKSRVEDMLIDPFDVTRERVGVFDVVLLSGVVYHVKNPWLLLERAADVTRELLIIETATDFNLVRRPAIAVYTHGELNYDSTSWCAPNIAALKAILTDVGFKQVKVVWKEKNFLSLRAATQSLIRIGISGLASLQRGRCAIHAIR